MQPEPEASIHTDPLRILRQKWSEVPAGNLERQDTGDLLERSDKALFALWQEKWRESVTGTEFSVRGWYQTLYQDVLSGKRVMDVGSGFGIDGLFFAQHGAQITFVDIVESNLEILQRIAHYLQLHSVNFHYINSFDDFRSLDHNFDIIWAQGSMINAPFVLMQQECALILEHLKPEGRWIELAYPKERWIREGSLPFEDWGRKTDGERTPWMEYYDLQKLLARLSPVEFDVVLSLNFHNDDFNWFDLRRVSADE